MMSVKEMVGRLQSLGRMVAGQAATAEDLSTHEKCQEAARLFLEILDGKTPYFPKCNINPNPHMDDVAEAKADGRPWLDMDTSLLEDLSSRYAELAKEGSQDWPDRKEGAYTPDEVTGMFLQSVQSAAQYWADLVHQVHLGEEYSDLDCCEGTIFSILNVLDGTNVAAPMFDVVPDIDDIMARPEVSNFQGLVLDTYMHEQFYQAEVFNPSTQDMPAL